MNFKSHKLKLLSVIFHFRNIHFYLLAFSVLGPDLPLMPLVPVHTL